MDATDHDFRLIFKEEAESRLARLGQLLLELEVKPTDTELTAEIFREAHTLKGAAAVVGLTEVTRVAHALEDLLAEWRNGTRATTPGLIDVVITVVDRLGEIVAAALDGQSHDAEATAAIALLHTAIALEAVAPTPADGPAPAAEPDAARPPDPVPVPVPLKQRAPSSGSLQVPVERMDELVRLVTEAAASHLRLGRRVTRELHDAEGIGEFRELSRVLNELQETAMRLRMVPVATIARTLQRAVRELARATGKEVRWELRGGDTELDRQVLEDMADPLLHLIRNAVDHGIETPDERVARGKDREGVVRLHAMQLGPEVVLAVSDDGAGIDVARVRREAERGGTDTSAMGDDEMLYVIFRSGLSTSSYVTDVSGRGVGLDVVRAQLDTARGRVEVRSEPGVGSEFRIAVPITLAILPCLMVRCSGQSFAIPVHSVTTALAPDAGNGQRAQGRDVVVLGNRSLALSTLASTIGLPEGKRGPVVVLAGLTRSHAFQVDALIGKRDVVMKGLGGLLPRLEVVAGASMEPDGSILLVLETSGLIERGRRQRRGADPAPGAVAALTGSSTGGPEGASILVVDDALTVRELQRSILERAGYRVRTAVDGVEALALLAEFPADLVLTDVEMPRLDGFGLTEAIRGNSTLARVPVIVLTSRSTDEDRKRGLEAGADAYIVKTAFDQASLLAIVERLLGRGQ